MHQAFEIGVGAKILFALLEALSGLSLLVIKTGWIAGFARWITASELGEDPGDNLAGWVLRAAEGFSIDTQHFWAMYLIVHGVVKLAALSALLSGVRWAYPLSIAVLFGFIGLQLHRFLTTHSPFMLALSVFDLVVIWLIWQEYRTLPRRSGA
ncbi:MAG: DUF2127 domain-containing protein [Rhodobacteraceae bacterium]|nr:DUF2127 domain-containing protein [Paracoccaceae bacterium]